MDYVDFDYYKDTYEGTKITSEALFEPLAKTESRNLDIPTFYRLQEEDIELTDEEWDKIKTCLCELIEMQYDFDNKYVNSAVVSGIKSESVDGFSRTYLSPAELEQAKKDLVKNKDLFIKGRLASTGLLYRG